MPRKGLNLIYLSLSLGGLILFRSCDRYCIVTVRDQMLFGVRLVAAMGPRDHSPVETILHERLLTESVSNEMTGYEITSIRIVRRLRVLSFP